MAAPASLTLLSWNVNGRAGQAGHRQLEFVCAQGPSIIALQELTSKTLPDWRDRLKREGYEVVDTGPLLSNPHPPPGTEDGFYPSPPYPPRRRGGQIRRTYANLVATRLGSTVTLDGLDFANTEFGEFALPEKHLSIAFEHAGRTVHLHNTHLPPGVSSGLLKVECFEALARRVEDDVNAGIPTLLVGDFNAPLVESSSARGPVYPETPPAAWHGASDRWQRAERSVVASPKWRDVYWDVHEPGTRIPTSHRTGPRGTSRRYDHIFATREFDTASCTYIEGALDEAWSDHAPVLASLTLRPRDKA